MRVKVTAYGEPLNIGQAKKLLHRKMRAGALAEQCLWPRQFHYTLLDGMFEQRTPDNLHAYWFRILEIIWLAWKPLQHVEWQSIEQLQNSAPPDDWVTHWKVALPLELWRQGVVSVGVWR